MKNTTNTVYNALADHLLKRLDYIRIQPMTVLVSARNPEFIVQQLQNRYPLAVIQVVLKMDGLSVFAAESFDLIFSHFTVTQTNEPPVFLMRLHNLLKNEGLLLLTTAGPDTFFELRASFSRIDSYAHTHDFFDMHHVGDWLRALHFQDPVVDREEYLITYDKLALFFQDLKEANVTNKHVKRRLGLMTKNQWMRMEASYVRNAIDGTFPVTIEMIYGHGWKVKTSKGENLDDEYVVPVEKIRRRVN